MTIAEVLYVLDISQASVARRLGISPSLMCHKANGRVRFEAHEAGVVLAMCRKKDPTLEYHDLFPLPEERAS